MTSRKKPAVLRGRKIAIAAFILLSILLIVLWPAFLLPGPLYQAVYGWRFPQEWRCGDAEIVDYGPVAAYDRVIVDFGIVDLGVETDLTFELCAVPRQLLGFGMELELPPDVTTEPYREMLGDTVVELYIEVQDSRVVHLGSGDLSRYWVWSCCGTTPAHRHSFIYGHPNSFFKPRRSEVYMLHLRISPAPEAPSQAVRLLAEGGGWMAPQEFVSGPDAGGGSLRIEGR